MALWIDVNDIKEIIPINPAHPHGVEFNSYIEAAQFEDLKPLLGEDLYNEMLRDITATSAGGGTYPNLLNEYNYSWKSKNYTNPGANKVLAFFAAARYRYVGQDTDTALGYQGLEGQNMRKSDEQRNRNMYTHLRKSAEAYWVEVERYLNRVAGKSAAYTLWVCSDPQIDQGEEAIIINTVTVR